MAPGAMAELDTASLQKIEVHGEIRQHCAISSPGSFALGDLERDGLRADVKFGLDCNTPFIMKIEAARGALTNIAYPRGQGPYAGTLPYVFELTIPVRKPASGLITRSFNSRDLLGGQTLSSGGAIASDGMEAHVTLGHPDGMAGLLAGDYSETITVTLSVI